MVSAATGNASQKHSVPYFGGFALQRRRPSSSHLVRILYGLERQREFLTFLFLCSSFRCLLCSASANVDNIRIHSRADLCQPPKDGRRIAGDARSFHWRSQWKVPGKRVPDNGNRPKAYSDQRRDRTRASVSRRKERLEFAFASVKAVSIVQRHRLAVLRRL